jgi:lysophospholipase L1-like esterase
VQEGTGRSQIEKAIEIFKHREPPSLIVVSVGGNDAGFSGIGTMCLLPGKCSDKPEYWATAESFAQLQYELEAVYAQIDAAFPQSPVVVIPYPDPFYAGPGNKCGDLLLDEDEIAFVRTFLLGDPAESTPSPRPDRTFPPTPSPTAATLRAVPTVLPSPASSRTPAPARTPEPAVRTIGLDRTIRWTAQAHGFYYATDMMTALADEGIQLCNKDERDPGLHFIGLRSVKGVAEQRFNPQNWTHSSLHPNARGHAALLRAFDRWYQGVLADQAAADPNGRAATNHLLDKRVPNSPLGVSVSYGRSTCWINVKYTGIDESRGCRYLAKQWQTHQVGKALWQWGVATALTLDIFAGALLSIVLTALRRRRYQDAVEQDPHHSVFP